MNLTQFFSCPLLRQQDLPDQPAEKLVVPTTWQQVPVLETPSCLSGAGRRYLALTQHMLKLQLYSIKVGNFCQSKLIVHNLPFVNRLIWAGLLNKICTTIRFALIGTLFSPIFYLDSYQ